MLYCRDRMMPRHTRTCITHGFPHPFAHGWLVAMYRTLFAGRFLLAKLAMIKPGNSIVKQGGAIFAKPIFGMVVAFTIYLYHLADGLLLLIDACHRLFAKDRDHLF